jgi:hypothetical protein
VRHNAPAVAQGGAGQDYREVLRTTNERSHVLADRGDRLELAFALPPLAPGRRREGFVLTHGYYNVHAPPHGDWSPLALRDIRDRPGALAAFGVELARGYLHLTAPASPGAAP